MEANEKLLVDSLLDTQEVTDSSSVGPTINSLQTSNDTSSRIHSVTVDPLLSTPNRGDFASSVPAAEDNPISGIASIFDELRAERSQLRAEVETLRAEKESAARTYSGALCQLQGELTGLREAKRELLAALNLVWMMFDDGRIVRNISNDGRSDWALRMLEFTRELQTIQAALAKHGGAA